jgi:Cu+-exporting ATPase
MATDPVCKMEVAPDAAAAHSEWRGQSYHFCSKSCKAKFDSNPESFLRNR